MDGRCSRLAFSNPEKFSKITGIPEDLIRDFDKLVIALCSGADIIPSKFDEDAQFWLDRFHGNANISWNVLCPTVIHISPRSRNGIIHVDENFTFLGSSRITSWQGDS